MKKARSCSSWSSSSTGSKAVPLVHSSRFVKVARRIEDVLIGRLPRIDVAAKSGRQGHVHAGLAHGLTCAQARQELVRARRAGGDFAEQCVRRRAEVAWHLHGEPTMWRKCSDPAGYQLPMGRHPLK